jgi:DNA-binding transcriptional ArsR family regulator
VSRYIVPAARVDRLITTEAGDEVLVYDQATHHIHHLNMTSVAVWRLCDGHRTVSELAAATGLSDDLVRLALTRLSRAKLLDAQLPATMGGEVQSRRRFMKKAAIAGGIALPVVVSMTAPSAAQAASCDMDGCTVEDVGKPCGVGPISCSFLTCRIGELTGFPYCGV